MTSRQRCAAWGVLLCAVVLLRGADAQLRWTAAGTAARNADTGKPADAGKGADNGSRADAPGRPGAAGSVAAVTGDAPDDSLHPRTTIEVTAGAGDSDFNGPQPYHVTASEILSSAGTYGDFSRYMQQFPGVVFSSDQSDDILVRGGHPMENLFLVDGLEVPNLNHIATEGTTGGFASMIDTNAIENLDLHTGGYDASYPERLSSVIAIHTREMHGARRHVEGDLGIVGAGVLWNQAFHSNDALLVSAHKSLLSLFTNDIGLNGVPEYSNLLSTLHLNPTHADRVTVLSLSGLDSIDIRPCPGNWWETNTINTKYAGWRTTNGVSWQHIYSPKVFSLLSLSDSEQQESIDQVDQILRRNPHISWTDCSKGIPWKGTPVYKEHSLTGTSTAKYDVQWEAAPRVSVLAGTTGRLVRPNYRIAQPEGAQSPLSPDPTRSDATSFRRNFITGETGSYAEGVMRPTGKWSVRIGGRVQSFALGGHWTVTPRVSTAYTLSNHIGLHAAYGRYAQLPPYVEMLSYAQNGKLKPIYASHYVLGSDLWQSAAGRVSLEIYRKDYDGYPVSSEYPSLSLANMVDMLGQQFLWLPLVSGGKGRSEGVELYAQRRLSGRFQLQGTLAYARARFSGLDGVMRKSNYDLPVVANVSGVYQLARGLDGSFRYEYTTGRPYTPFLLDPSLAQDRPIYDLSRVNGARAPFYSRLDFQLNKEFRVGDSQLIVYAGLENALNRGNFLAYAWEPRQGSRHIEGEIPVDKVRQLPRFPNFGVRYLF